MHSALLTTYCSFAYSLVGLLFELSKCRNLFADIEFLLSFSFFRYSSNYWLTIPIVKGGACPSELLLFFPRNFTTLRFCRKKVDPMHFRVALVGHAMQLMHHRQFLCLCAAISVKNSLFHENFILLFCIVQRKFSVHIHTYAGIHLRASSFAGNMCCSLFSIILYHLWYGPNEKCSTVLHCYIHMTL